MLQIYVVMRLDVNDQFNMMSENKGDAGGAVQWLSIVPHICRDSRVSSKLSSLAMNALLNGGSAG